MTKLSSTFLTEVTCIWGGRGGGKSTKAKELIGIAKPKKLVIIDPLASDGMSYNECVKALSKKQKIITLGSNVKREQLWMILRAYALSTVDNPIYVLCDEAPAYLDNPKDDEHPEIDMLSMFKKVMFQGRHAAFGMCLVGQRPASVNVLFRSQAAITYWMRLNDHCDIQTAGQSIGTDRAKSLQEFKAGQFIQHPPT